MDKRRVRFTQGHGNVIGELPITSARRKAAVGCDRVTNCEETRMSDLTVQYTQRPVEWDGWKV